MDGWSIGFMIFTGLIAIGALVVIVYAIRHEDECPHCGARIEKGPLQETLFGFAYIERCPQCGWSHCQHVLHEQSYP